MKKKTGGYVPVKPADAPARRASFSNIAMHVTKQVRHTQDLNASPASEDKPDEEQPVPLASTVTKRIGAFQNAVRMAHRKSQSMGDSDLTNVVMRKSQSSTEVLTPPASAAETQETNLTSAESINSFPPAENVSVMARSKSDSTADQAGSVLVSASTNDTDPVPDASSSAAVVDTTVEDGAQATKDAEQDAAVSPDKKQPILGSVARHNVAGRKSITRAVTIFETVEMKADEQGAVVGGHTHSTIATPPVMQRSHASTEATTPSARPVSATVTPRSS